MNREAEFRAATISGSTQGVVEMGGTVNEMQRSAARTGRGTPISGDALTRMGAKNKSKKGIASGKMKGKAK